MGVGIASAMLAERKRGLRFIENFRSSADVIKNGGSATDVTFDPHTGATFNGTTSKIDYSEKFSLTGDLTLIMRVKITATTPSHATIANINSNNFRVLIFKSGSGYFLSGYYNGSFLASAVVVNSYIGQWVWVGIRWDGTNFQVYFEGTSVATATPAAIVDTTRYPITIGCLTAGTQHCPMECDKTYFFNEALTDQEILDYSNNDTFTYMRAASLLLPMTTRDDDTPGLKTLDRSGYGNDAVFGDGSTPTTYPTKLTNNKGYYFDGGDYLACGDSNNLGTGDFTISILAVANTLEAAGIGAGLICKYAAGDTSYWYLTLGTGGAIFGAKSPAGALVSVTAAGITANRRVHICITCERDTANGLIIYIDGEPIATSTLASTYDLDNASDLLLGIEQVNNKYLVGDENCAKIIIGMALTPLQVYNDAKKSLIKLNDAYP